MAEPARRGHGGGDGLRAAPRRRAAGESVHLMTCTGTGRASLAVDAQHVGVVDLAADALAVEPCRASWGGSPARSGRRVHRRRHVLLQSSDVVREDPALMRLVEQQTQSLSTAQAGSPGQRLVARAQAAQRSRASVVGMTLTAGEPEEPAARTFADLGLRPELLAELVALGYEEPTPIQAEAVPPLLAGRDVLGQAATGTGKTAAFALPLLQRLAPGHRGREPVGLVLTPTRELAMQVSEALHRYGRGLGARVLPVYGGQPIGRQLRELERGVDVVVATPGRALDHLRRGTLRLDALQVVVLDEADEMLDMGFADELDAIMAAVPADRQTVLFSATLPGHIDRLARRHLSDPVRIAIGRPVTAGGQAPLVRQTAYVVARADKPAALGRVLDMEAPGAALVFCRTREEVDSLTQTLNGRGYRAEPLHGGMSQDQRDRVMGRLRARTADLLVATDVAARGLDVDHLTHVVNYDVPSAPDSYVHRIGRVGRAGREGVAITLAEPREQRMLQTIERVTGQRIPLARLPSVADLRALRLEALRAALRDGLLRGDLDAYRPTVASLADEFDLEQVALAAVRLAHEAAGLPPDEAEIVQPPARPPTARHPAGRSDRDEHSGRPAAATRSGVPPRSRRGPPGGTTRLFVGSGRESGVRPQDLVGAVTGESSLSGRDIGAIEIFQRFSLVEVPEAAADEVVAALRATLIKGRKATVRRELEARRPPRPPDR